MKFGGALSDAVTGTLVDFLESEVVGAGRIGRAAKGAEFAVSDADVGGIDVTIDVEIGDIAMLFFADEVREPAYGEKIVRFIQRETVRGVETFAGKNLYGYRLEASVVYLQSV